MNFSIRAMVLLTAVICMACAAGVYMWRIPVIVDDFYAMFGRAPPPHEGSGRSSWLTFLIFTYTAPMIMAAVFYALHLALRWYEARYAQDDAEPASPFD